LQYFNLPQSQELRFMLVPQARPTFHGKASPLFFAHLNAEKPKRHPGAGDAARGFEMRACDICG
jgi:hypothetical protein